MTTPSTGPADVVPAPSRPPAPPHTGTVASRVLGALALASIVLAVLYGLVWSPPDAEMRDSVRLFYVHVPSASFLYLGCLITTVASGLWLWRRTPGWDALAGASAEIALVFSAITLGTGSLWGRPTWGTYWTWDARLTTTALLAVLLVGYLALRRLDLDVTARSTRAAVLGLLLVPNVVVVNRSVEWWRSLHQRSTVSTLDPQIEGDMLVAVATGFLACALVFTWLLVHRFRVAWLEYQADRLDLDTALAARRAEAGDPSAGDPPAGDPPARRPAGRDERRGGPAVTVPSGAHEGTEEVPS